jgi:MFS family permease
MSEPTRLWNRNYTLLWQGQFVSQLGSQAFFIAMAFWIKHETGSATIMGLFMMASQIPAVLLSPIAGAYADSHPRKAIMVACDLINGALTISLAMVFLIWPERIDWSIMALFMVAVLTSAVSAFFRPAVLAAIPDIVPRDRLNAANSFNQGSLQMSTLLGLSVGGVLYRVLGAPLLFLIDGISYIISAISEMFMAVPFSPPETVDSSRKAWQRMVSEIKAGFLYIWRRTGMRNLMVMAAALNFFSMPYIVLMPFFVEDTLGGTPDWFGYIFASFSAGVLLGYAAAGTLRLSGPRRSQAMVTALIVQTALLSVMGMAPGVRSVLVIIFVAGVANGFFNITLQTLFQLTTPAGMRGRVFSLLATVTQGLTPIGMGLSGAIADLLEQDIRMIYVCTGASCLLIALAVSLSRDYRAYLAYEDRPENTAATAGG